MSKLPPIRTDIDLMPVRLGERDVILIRDPLEIAAPNTALTAEVAPYLPLFNGFSTVGDLQIAMMRHHGGSLVFRTDAERIVADLSRTGILQTEEYRETRARIVAEFSAGLERKAALAGNSYPADAGELASLLDGILSLPFPSAERPAGPPCALVSPHIDLRAAERTYAAAFAAAGGLAPSAILLLGTGHRLGETRYCISAKTFVTPLGRVPADRYTVERIRAAGGEAVSPDDFPHRNEHSIELPLLFLQRTFEMEKVPILPVLCGQMEDLFGRVRSPLEAAGVASVVDALSEWLRAPPEGKLIVAGVDLSHVGPKFGDPHTGRSLEPAVRASDREVLDALAEGDADSFFRAGAKSRNRYRICGFSALWTLLAVAPAIRGTVLDYDIWHEEPTRSAVSFAAVAFARHPPENPVRTPRPP